MHLFSQLFLLFLLQTRLSLFELCWTTETWLCDSDCGEFWIHCCVCWQYYRHFRGRSCLIDGKVYQKTLIVSSTNRLFSVFIFFLQIASMGKGGWSHKSVTFLLRFYPWTNFTCSEIDFSQWNVWGFFVSKCETFYIYMYIYMYLLTFSAFKLQICFWCIIDFWGNMLIINNRTLESKKVQVPIYD